MFTIQNFKKEVFLSNLLKYFEGKNKNIELHSQNIIKILFM